MLKTTAGLVVAGAIGVGLGYGASELLRPAAPPGVTTTVTQTGTETVTATATAGVPVEEETRHPMLLGDIIGGQPAWVYTKGGRIIRVTPMTYAKDESKPWSITAGGKTFTPRTKSNLATYDQGYRRIVYSPTRVKYPLKRVGYAPGGGGSVENRGKGEFVRISWDEAFDIMASELKRIKEKYGNAAILEHDNGHAQQQYVHQRFKIRRLLRFFGGHTTMIRNPDSNEGWHWGGWNVCGMMGPPTGGLGNSSDLLEDTMQNSKLLIEWATDGLAVFEGAGNDHADWWNWIKGLGIKIVCVDSDLNEFAAKYADKWIAPLPGTDAALMAAIANVWINEGTYEKEYVQTHGVGFDKWKDYVMGAEDGVAKTPEWAAKITGVQARDIRALAREWASKPTCISTNQMACRGPYSTEHTRMAILLMTMQGEGKPGRHFLAITSAPTNPEKRGTWAPHGGMPFEAEPADAVLQSVQYMVFPDAILNPPVKWYGGINAEKVEPGKASTQPPEEFTIWGEFAPDWRFYLGIFTHPSQQFVSTTYPMEGYPEVKMYWSSLASYITNWNHGYKWMETFKSPKLESIFIQVPWLENDCYFADLVLPVSTQVEHDDLMLAQGNSYGNDVAVRMEKCIEPIGESKTDLEICTEIAKRLGIEKEYTEGRTLDDMLRFVYERDFPEELTKQMSFDEFSKKGYYVFKFPDMSTYKSDPGMRWYADLPEGSGLATPSGKIEFESTNLKKFFPNDKERPPVPHYVAEGPTHQESVTSARGKKYPLLLATSHSRFKWHSRYTSEAWTWETTSSWYVKAKNGNWYWSLWINPIDAEARGIAEGDVVNIFNDRGEILAGAHVTERARPGMVRCTFAAPYRPILTGDNPLMDTMGSPALISPYNPTSANAIGMASGWFLVEVKKA
jgi:trimethylamine-N-oxide reductase (cytochrome c)